jgi:hypothetical protein
MMFGEKPHEKTIKRIKTLLIINTIWIVILFNRKYLYDYSFYHSIVAFFKDILAGSTKPLFFSLPTILFLWSFRNTDKNKDFDFINATIKKDTLIKNIDHISDELEQFLDNPLLKHVVLWEIPKQEYRVDSEKKGVVNEMSSYRHIITKAGVEREKFIITLMDKINGHGRNIIQDDVFKQINVAFDSLFTILNKYAEFDEGELSSYYKYKFKKEAAGLSSILGKKLDCYEKIDN